MDRENFKKDLITTISSVLKECKEDTTSQDGYITMLSYLENLPLTSRKSFLSLCIKCGYPQNTGTQLLQML